MCLLHVQMLQAFPLSVCPCFLRISIIKNIAEHYFLSMFDISLYHKYYMSHWFIGFQNHTCLSTLRDICSENWVVFVM